MTARWPGLVLLFVGCAGDMGETRLPQMPDFAASNPLAHGQFVLAFSRVESTSGASAEARAQAVGELAELFDAYERPEEALGLYDRALALAPENADWTYHRAAILERQGDLSEAITGLRKLTLLDPEDLAARLRLARCLDRSGDADEAAGVLEEVLMLEPRNGEALAYLADRALARGDFGDAIRRLEKARSSLPKSRILAFALGRAYLAAGRKEDAEPLLEAASKHSIEARPRGNLDPRRARLQALVRSPLAHERRGQAALDREDWMVAIVEFRQALALEPSLRAVRHNLAAAQLRLGRRQEAMQTLRENTRSSETFVPSVVLLAVMVDGEGRSEEADALLAGAEAADPDSSLVSTARGQIERVRGRPETAAELLEKVVARSPGRSTAWLDLVASYLQAGSSAKAVQALDRFGKALPEDPSLEPLSWRSAALEGSVVDCRRVVRNARQDRQYLVSEAESWAFLLSCAGRWEEAIEAQRGAVNALPEGSPAARVAQSRLDSYLGKQTAVPAWLAEERWMRQPARPVMSGERP